MKKCLVCENVLPLSAFCRDKTRKDGHMFRCKECEIARDSNRQDRRYASRREYFLNYQKEYKERFKKKVFARLAVKEATKNGILKKSPCRDCGDEDVRGHHPDYSKPLKVVWLCQKHHQRVHAKLKSTPPRENN